MQENNKRIAKNTLFLYFRMMLSMAVSLYTSRVVLRTLGVEDFGINGVVGGVIALFLFVNSSMSEATSRFLTFELGRGNVDNLKKTFSSALTIHILIAFIVLVSGETAGFWFLENKLVIPENRMFAARWVYHLSILGAMISITQVPYNAIIIAHERMNTFAYIEILNVCLKLGIVYLLVIGNFDKLILYSVLSLCVSIIIVSIYRIYCIKNFKESRYKYCWDKEIIKPMLSYSGWNLMGCGAVVGCTQGINILLNIFFGPAVNAARSISVQVNSQVYAFVSNFQTAVSPQIIKLYAAKKKDELLTLLFRNSKFSFCLIWIFSLPVFLKIEIVLDIWLTEVPEYTPLFCRLILLQSLIYCTQRPFVVACHATGKIRKFQLLTTPSILLVLPISYLFLRFGYPVYFPFIVYVIMTIVEYMIELILLRQWIGLSFLKYFNEVFIPVFIVIVSSFLFPFALSQFLEDNYLSFFVVCGISVLNAVLSIYCFALDKHSRRKVLISVLNKLGSL